MELYLLKFSVCLLVFWLSYVLLLEKQKMHHFKRFYLLSSFAIALIIPQLTIVEYIEPIVQNFEVTNAFIPIEEEVLPQPIETTPVLTLETILWSIYVLGATLFAVRFAVNLFRLYRQIATNNKQYNHSFIYVLLKTYRIPHSFFKYIFVNQQQFENNQIPEEVRLHEETHAKQWHSLDILLLELFQIVFWFHPLVYVLKHHVKLNHEFLADDAVLQQGVTTKTYQNILLQFSSNTHNHQLASAINYSSFKKRFTVMKTQTSKTRIWLSTLLVLPVLAILFYSFAEREYVEKEQSENLITENNSFLVFVEKNGNTLELRCESGCKWSHLVLEPNSKPYIINDFGFSEGNTLDTDKFAFSIKPNQSGVTLSGLKGTAWVDLAFSLPKNQKQAVNQLGMTNETVNKKGLRDEKVLIIKAVNNSLYINNKKSSLENYVKDLNKITENWTEEDFDLTRFDLKKENCSQSFLDNLNELHKKTDHFLMSVIGLKSSINQRKKRLHENQQDAVKHYKEKYKAYQKIRTKKPHYINKSTEEQKKMDTLFSELGSLYFKMSKKNKAKVERPISPVHPYTQITLNGKTYYKKSNELTAEEKATLPPPPPPPPVPAKKNEWQKVEDILDQQKPVMWILVNIKGQLLVDDEVGTLESIKKKLKKLSKTKSSKGTVAIKFDSEAPKKTVNEVKSIVQKSGFEVFTIGTNQIPPPPPPPPAPEPPKKTTKGGPNANGVYQTNKIEPIEIYIDGKNNIQFNGKKVEIADINNEVKKLNKHLSTDEHRKYVMASIAIEKNKSADLAKSIQLKLKEANVWSTCISYNESIAKSNLPKRSLNLYSGLTVEEAKAKEKKIFSNSADTEKKIDSINKSSSPWKVKATTASYEFIDDDGNSTGKIKIDQTEESQKSILPKVNDKVISSPLLKMTKKEFKKLKLSTEKGKVISFKLKIPGVATEYIDGNTITKTTISNLTKMNHSKMITAFDIKDEKSSNIAPLIIEITD